MKNRVAGGKRPIKWRALGALGIGSTGLLGSAAVAGVVTTSLVFTLTVATQSPVKINMMQWLTPLVSTMTVVASTGSTTAKPATTTIPTSTNVGSASSVAVPAAPAGIKPMMLGMNIAGPSSSNNARMFMNLLAGSRWTFVDATGKWTTPPADRLDDQQNITMLQGKESAVRSMSIPTRAYMGASVDIICRWKGAAGTVAVNGPAIKNVKKSANSLTFTFVMTPDRSKPNFFYSNMPAGNPLRDIDCREADADPNALFDPLAVADAKRYNSIRFLGWSAGVNANIESVTWESRTKPGDGIINGPDTVPIEYMVKLANDTQTNPWFLIPWNASDDYIRNMAIYVRDNLDPNLKAHVELSNEVWNWVFPQTVQARNEAKAANLYPSNDGLAMLYRYGQKTGEVMDVWSSVYAGQMSRLVRIIAFQNGGSWGANLVLKWDGGNGVISKKVDAVATAPYFGYKLAAGSLSTAAQIDAFFNTNVEQDIESAISGAKAVKTVATTYGLRYMTYEAGQHYISDGDVTQLEKISRDYRMGKAYTRYLTRWRNEIGDQITLLADYGPISKYGAWGNQEYITQPLNEAPKANAVELFRRSYISK
jgi:hypothetical protein